MKLFTAILAGLFLALQYALWFGDKNFFDLHRLQQATETAQRENISLSQRNDKLTAEVRDLKEGGKTVETLARSEYGLIKEGETFYHIVE